MSQYYITISKWKFHTFVIKLGIDVWILVSLKMGFWTKYIVNFAYFTVD